MTTQFSTIRQGLPRVPGGSPWPPLSALPDVPGAEPSPPFTIPEVTARDCPSSQLTENAGPTEAVAGHGAIRRGLPRSEGGSPWPPVDLSFVPTAPPRPSELRAEPEGESGPIHVDPTGSEERLPHPTQQVPTVAELRTQQPPSPRDRQVDGTETPRRLTRSQRVLAVVLGAFCAFGMATALVLLARWVAGLEDVASFLSRYSGEYHLPDSAPVGIPAWLGWQHFFNFFLMVLIIRSGLLVRNQSKPPAYWSSKRSPKISIYLWLHQSLDVLWLVNGVVFLTLLSTTGQWMRIVPTSWEVFPHALSAGLQYLTLDWPTENGWVNYNSLQQLAYFTTVFVAAPLAAITGVRMSAFWPKNPRLLTRLYPVALARALHFPVMLYFVVFIFIHVALVLSTGALRNLNHMYAAQGAVHPDEYAANWTGLIMLAGSLLVVAGAWVACRPAILTPLAQRFGRVSTR